MKVLHIRDHHLKGGGYEASQSIIDLVGGEVYTNPSPNTWSQLWATICGFSMPSVRSEIRRQIYRLEPDVVHLHNFKEFGVAAIDACVGMKVPVVWSCYDYWAFCPRDNFHGPKCVAGSCEPFDCYKYPRWSKLPLWGRDSRVLKRLRRLNHIHALSMHSQSLLAGLIPRSRPPISVIPLPITVPEMQDTPKTNPNLVLCVGGSPSNKGGELFGKIKALVEARRPDVSCRQVGSKDREDALRNIASAQVLVVPEQWPNPGPVVIKEAGLLGTWVVASDVGGIREKVGDHVRLADPRSPEQFASHVLNVLRFSGDAPCTRPVYSDIKARIEKVYDRCARSSSR
jgi:glycosyltransferase involved in cell wall biosynthesis